MWTVQCPHCSTPTPGRCASTAAGRSVTECTTCDRAVEERQSHTHQLFLLCAHDTPLPLVTPDLSFPSSVDPQPNGSGSDDDPFHPTGFITAFSTWSLEPSPVFARSASSFAGHLAELERALGAPPSNDPAGPMVSVDQLRAYLQILDVASILELDREIVDHAFQLFRDCSSATCLRNRSVEALATAALVQAIREAQEPRTLQEISAASNLPQKEIGKYIKILGESLKLSQPINSNSISVHMPRFCTLLQLNKSAQELAAHIGEVVINKCFCTRRNPISISAAAIYLACQLEDKRKTQAEICKITGLTEVTLRKVYKELLENWDDLLPPNYTPAVPPEKAFPMTIITSGGRSSTPKVDADTSHLNLHQDKDRLLEIRKKISRPLDAMDIDPQVRVREEVEYKSCPQGRSLASLYTRDLNQAAFWQPQFPFGATTSKLRGEKEHKVDNTNSTPSDCEQKVEPDSTSNAVRWMGKGPALTSSQRHSRPWKQHICSDSAAELQGVGDKNKGGDVDGCHGND